MLFTPILNTKTDHIPCILAGTRISPTLEEIKNEISLEMFLLASIMILIQVMDGLLTGFGVQLFGISAEGNSIVKFFMQKFGHIQGLFIIKTTAILVVTILARLSLRVRWIPKAMKGVIALYLALAILPWTYILIAELI